MNPRGYVAIFATIFMVVSQVDAHLLPIDLTPTCLQSVNDVCKSSGLLDLVGCVKTLSSFPNIATTKDVKGIAQIALHVSRKQSIRARDLLATMADSALTNPSFTASLKKCSSSFNETLMSLNLNGLEGGTASLDVHYALDCITSCENDFQENQVNIPLVAVQIHKWKRLFSIAYGAVMLVENTSSGGGEDYN